MKKLTKKQKELLSAIEALPEPTYNTTELCRLLGHRQAYSSYLRDRLYRLKIPFTEKLDRNNHVAERRWNVKDFCWAE